MSIVGLHMEMMAKLAAVDILENSPNKETAERQAMDLVKDARKDHENAIKAQNKTPKPHP